MQTSIAVRNYCVLLVLATFWLDICANQIPFDANNWLLLEEQLGQQLSPYRRHQRLPSDKPFDIDALVKSRQSHLRASDGIRFRRSGSNEDDISRGDLESALRLREKFMKVSDGIRFKKRDVFNKQLNNNY